ncbi:DgyrCDS5823 [Dimorphilus gyrociliatus]|uniref:DgyrCDS5823 n=1 Tax=Dimorphilus gyrociliatus TaxID=2664684 RepID=A0A7I8VL55_9ANNE|nr:DgyrCDS5823 [Dimorphilus gyrociliatus]
MCINSAKGNSVKLDAQMPLFGKLFDNQEVYITIKDENDEVPVFKNAPYPFRATVPHNAAPGTSVYQLMAEDPDGGSEIRYVMESGEDSPELEIFNCRAHSYGQLFAPRLLWRQFECSIAILRVYAVIKRRGDDRFVLDPVTGVVTTIGDGVFSAEMYQIGVSAQDISAPLNQTQKSNIEALSIYVGTLDPQFYEPSYEASIKENTDHNDPKQNVVIVVRAFSHQNERISYELFSEKNRHPTEFSIDRTTGTVKLMQSLDFEKDPHKYVMKVMATESSSPPRTSQVSLIVSLIDVNDNSPIFPLSQYTPPPVFENAELKKNILVVSAYDADSKTNAQLEYSVSDPNFSVISRNNMGRIVTKERLDYDRLPNHVYNFTITARDHGNPRLSGEAMVRIKVININDEAPVFQRVETVQVNEDTPPYTDIHVIQAYDPDGDNITFGFAGQTSLYSYDGLFKLDKNSGKITLEKPLAERSRNEYTLNVSATDDGSCCKGGRRLTSYGIVKIKFKDVNNNAPKFEQCSQYRPSVKEHSKVGTTVFQVKATDKDWEENGEVTYSIVKSTKNAQFSIDSITGTLKTEEIFDREQQTGVYDLGVTVKAVDKGKPSLAGFCTFRVRIDDINDHEPVFDMPRYEATIDQSRRVGSKIIQVHATDKDANENGRVRYLLKSHSRYFRVNIQTGWITLKEPIIGIPGQYENITVVAEDKGKEQRSSTARVSIQIIRSGENTYPQWNEDSISGKFYVDENVEQNHLVCTLKATSGSQNTLVSYTLEEGVSPETNNPRSFFSRPDDTQNAIEILTYKALDYETVPKYTLTVRAVNKATHALRNVTRIEIHVRDKNDEIPQFIGLDENGRYQGSVAENSKPGTPVISVTATDRDSTPAFKEITYALKKPIYNLHQDVHLFDIDTKTGLITTKDTFDRETKHLYYITVTALDGAMSDRPKVMNSPNRVDAEVVIHITDQNDEIPFFRKRMERAVVKENVEPNHTIMRVTADDRDVDPELSYSIVSGNDNNVFEVVSHTGEIRVRNSLDYEKKEFYQLEYRVFDGKHMSNTHIEIKVEDVNDNPPVFDRLLYNITHVYENAKASKSRPLRIGRVRATDPDRGRHYGQITYGITGQFFNEGYFSIDRKNGYLYLTKPLDREPPGREMWSFNVLAHDESGSPTSLTGYAEVQVWPLDVNDNPPVFQEYPEAWVRENGKRNEIVTTIRATDADRGMNAKIDYMIRKNIMRGPRQMFSIDPTTGDVRTNVGDTIDREKKDYYEITVEASDNGRPKQKSSMLLRINVKDINDKAPKFVKRQYYATMSEDYDIGTSIISVSAIDDDIGANAELHYELIQKDRTYFKIDTIRATNTGVLKVHRKVDYEELSQKYSSHFNLTVEVTDNDPSHSDKAFITIKVEDANDETPVFLPPRIIKREFKEDKSVGSIIATFEAEDRDSGRNKEIEYRVERGRSYEANGDPKGFFNISQDGKVRIAKNLDREFHTHYFINILAVDRGTPRRTGTSQLNIILEDVNDNPPQFAKDYQPVVMENQGIGIEVLRFCAIDKDSSENGPPFKFYLPPSAQNPTADDFALEFHPNKCSGRSGMGILSTKKQFDRERQKYYLVPIVMVDNGKSPQTGTNTLTVTIGDVNDNDHYPGHKDITMYSYGDAYIDTPLGHVYARDEDDWDRDDKEFELIDRSLSRWFDLNKRTGQLNLKKSLGKGLYKLKVKVLDRRKDLSVTSTAHVRILDIPIEAVDSAGSIRLSGITAEELIDKVDDSSRQYSLYDKLRHRLATVVNTALDNVLIFSVKNHNKLFRTTDVFWAAHGSPWYSPVKLNGLVNKHREHLEKSLNVKILQSPVDECSSENVCGGEACFNKIIIDKERPLLVNTNTTSMIGVNAITKAICACKKSFEKTGCEYDTCLHGGVCVPVQPYDKKVKGFRCRCPKGFDGPRCEQTAHSFSGQSSFAWYSPLLQCDKSHINFKFITTSPDGLLLYNGPTQSNAEPNDYVIIELVDGLPKVRVNLGQGEAKIHFTNGKTLNDGNWHRLDTFIEHPFVRVIIDSCRALTGEKNDFDNEVVNSICEQSARLPGTMKLLNVNTPLQLGGRATDHRTPSYPHQVYKYGFKGCIKELQHNGKLYDLYIGDTGKQENAEDGCYREDSVCGRTAENELGYCGKNGKCVGSFIKSSFKCQCEPGWRGNQCQTPTMVRDFGEKSFIEWRFTDSFYESIVRRFTERTLLQLRFRTRSTRGVLWMASNIHKSQYVILEIDRGRLRFKFNAGSGEKNVRIDDVDVADGVWHVAKVERYSGDVWLSLDDIHVVHRHFSGRIHILLSQGSFFAGGLVKFPREFEIIVEYDLQNSCIDDVRYDGEPLQMTTSESMSDLAAYIASENEIKDHCRSDGCKKLMCLDPLHCKDLWRAGKCLCSDGYESYKQESVTTCTDINECETLFRPCGLHGTCRNTIGSYKCDCDPGWTGEECNRQELMDSSLMTTGAIFGIIFCILAIAVLVIILILIVYSRYKHRNYKANHVNGKTYMHGVDPDDDVRENIIRYEEDGVGDEDQNAYKPSLESIPLKKMQKPKSIDVPNEEYPPRRRQPRVPPPGADVADFICARVAEADQDVSAPPHDSLRPYAYEGEGSVCDSLSSLASTAASDETEHCYDYLGEWGPRFQRLADMYSARQMDR